MTVAELKSGLRKFPLSNLQARVDERPAPQAHTPSSQMVVAAPRPQGP